MTQYSQAVIFGKSTVVRVYNTTLFRIGHVHISEHQPISFQTTLHKNLDSSESFTFDLCAMCWRHRTLCGCGNIEQLSVKHMGRLCDTANQNHHRPCPDVDCHWVTHQVQNCKVCLKKEQGQDNRKPEQESRRPSSATPQPKPVEDGLRQPDPRNESVGDYIKYAVSQGFPSAAARELYARVWRTKYPELVSPPSHLSDLTAGQVLGN